MAWGWVCKGPAPAWGPLVVGAGQPGTDGRHRPRALGQPRWPSLLLLLQVTWGWDSVVSGLPGGHWGTRGLGTQAWTRSVCLLQAVRLCSEREGAEPSPGSSGV